MNINIDEILVDLPRNPELALVKIYERLDEKLSSVFSTDDGYRTANVILEQWCEQHHLWLWAGRTDDVKQQFIVYGKSIQQINRKASHNFVRGRVQEASRGTLPRFGYAKLDLTEKRAIHRRLDNVIHVVERSNLSSAQKNAICGKLSELAQEADREGTRTDGFLGLIADFAASLGQMAESAQPLEDDIIVILRILMHARARTERVFMDPEAI